MGQGDVFLKPDVVLGQGSWHGKTVKAVVGGLEHIPSARGGSADGRSTLLITGTS